MKLIYVKSSQICNYKSSGNIWGVLECKHPDTNTSVKLSGTLDRYPIHGDTLVIEKYDEVNHPKYGKSYKSNFIQVQLPIAPAMLPKYLKAAGITNAIAGFGEKKLAILCKHPDRVWNILKKDPVEWGEDYAEIPLNIREALCNNFAKFEVRIQTNKTLEMNVSLLLWRLGLEFRNNIVNNIVKFVQNIDLNGDLAECMKDKLLDMIGYVQPKYVRAIGESLGGARGSYKMHTCN